jgi:hypothetical protein
MKENETIENRINLYVRTRDYTANITKKRRKNRLFFEKKKPKYAERKNIDGSSAKQNYEYEKMK